MPLSLPHSRSSIRSMDDAAPISARLRCRRPPSPAPQTTPSNSKKKLCTSKTVSKTKGESRKNNTPVVKKNNFSKDQKKKKKDHQQQINIIAKRKSTAIVPDVEAIVVVKKIPMLDLTREDGLIVQSFVSKSSMS